jgi:hypothetical protein
MFFERWVEHYSLKSKKKLVDFPQHSMNLCPAYHAVFKIAYKTSFKQF